ncbi:MAG: hypothetical protein WC284_08235 [Candidimonas sp.]
MITQQIEHKRNSQTHTLRRAFERFGFIPTTDELKNIKSKIWKGTATWIRDTENCPRQVYQVELRNVKMKVVFDIRLDEIVTCLPIGETNLDRKRKKKKIKWIKKK